MTTSSPGSCANHAPGSQLVRHMVLTILSLWLAAAAVLFPWQDVDDEISLGQAWRMVRPRLRVGQRAPALPMPRAAVPTNAAAGLGSAYTIALFVASCENCNRTKIQNWAALCSESTMPLRLVVISRKGGAEGEASLAGLPGVELVQTDTHGLWRGYQVDFAPRAYLVDPRGILRYIQSPQETTFDAVDTVRRILSRPS